MMPRNQPSDRKPKSSTPRRFVAQAVRIGLFLLFGAAVLFSTLAWMVAASLAQDAGTAKHDFGPGHRVRLVVIEGHGRFAECRTPSTLRYLDRAFSGGVRLCLKTAI